MKKIITLLTSISLTASLSTFAISCGKKEEQAKTILGNIITNLDLGDLQKGENDVPSKETIYNKIFELHKEKWEENNIKFTLTDFSIPLDSWKNTYASIEANEDSSFTGKVLVNYKTV
ncbi:lipoprotein [Spiroplasma turonicum]|uniref:Lipoprotein n=1 Tax=Spiroplasma turonicum TaxID=216946 RepID=A0A0K1P612_9MOLU|nr:lipoprotein [Spiroplasma turonicum]AKU79753.1 hypothetical protein STURON_00507 [Spiroplasma turonicum]ALX70771.1 hypothetical protein STURO_v1c05050 [Spiroplasma turonicum]